MTSLPGLTMKCLSWIHPLWNNTSTHGLMWPPYAKINGPSILPKLSRLNHKLRSCTQSTSSTPLLTQRGFQILFPWIKNRVPFMYVQTSAIWIGHVPKTTSQHPSSTRLSMHAPNMRSFPSWMDFPDITKFRFRNKIITRLHSQPRGAHSHIE